MALDTYRRLLTKSVKPRFLSFRIQKRWVHADYN
jgi:hypothetical protein